MKIILLLILIIFRALNVYANVPEFNEHNARFMITADNWNESKIFLLNRFIVFGSRSIKLYSDQNLSKFSFEISGDKKLISGKHICGTRILEQGSLLIPTGIVSL